jgi:hypothetical protein
MDWMFLFPSFGLSFAKTLINNATVAANLSGGSRYHLEFNYLENFCHSFFIVEALRIQKIA